MTKLEKLIGKTASRREGYEFPRLQDWELLDQSISNILVSGLHLESYEIDEVTFNNGKFINFMSFGGIYSYDIFDDIEFATGEFYSPFFHEIKFRNCIFKDMKFSGGEFFSPIFENCVFKRTIFKTDGLGAIVYFDDPVFENCKFEDVLVEYDQLGTGYTPKFPGITLKQVNDPSAREMKP